MPIGENYLMSNITNSKIENYLMSDITNSKICYVLGCLTLFYMVDLKTRVHVLV